MNGRGGYYNNHGAPPELARSPVSDVQFIMTAPPKLHRLVPNMVAFAHWNRCAQVLLCWGFWVVAAQGGYVETLDHQKYEGTVRVLGNGALLIAAGEQQQRVEAHRTRKSERQAIPRDDVQHRWLHRRSCIATFSIAQAGPATSRNTDRAALSQIDG